MCLGPGRCLGGEPVGYVAEETERLKARVVFVFRILKMLVLPDRRGFQQKLPIGFGFLFGLRKGDCILSIGRIDFTLDGVSCD
jgi:hypothetical protein